MWPFRDKTQDVEARIRKLDAEYRARTEPHYADLTTLTPGYYWIKASENGIRFAQVCEPEIAYMTSKGYFLTAGPSEEHNQKITEAEVLSARLESPKPV